MLTRYFRVTLGKGARVFPDAWKNGYVGVGWLATEDLTGRLPEQWRDFNAEFIPLARSIDEITTNIGAGLACGQTWTLCRGIAEGDIVLSSNGQGQYAAGRIGGPYQYVPGTELCHRRPVSWLPNMIERDDISGDLRRSLMSSDTVHTLDAHSVELAAIVTGEHTRVTVSDPDVEDPVSFVFERHLEDFLVSNWDKTVLGREFDLYVVDGEVVGRQYPSDTGPIDILALKKDGSEVLVVELKRGRVSDVVVGQTLRYMGFVQELEPDKKVRGLIIGLEDDPKLRRALAVTPSVTFMRYEVKFQLHPAGG